MATNKKKRPARPAAPTSKPASSAKPAPAKQPAPPAKPSRPETLLDFEKLPKRRLAFALIGWGLLGLAGSLALAIETALWKADSNYDPYCSINPLISCTDSMEAFEGNLLGFPNAYLGVVLFTALIVIGIVVLAGVKLPGWAWYGLYVGLLGGIWFVGFFLVVSIFSLQKLCPYCMVVWLATVPVFVVGLAWLLQERHVAAPEGLRVFWVRNRTLITAGILTAIAVAVIFGFLDKWHLVF